MYFAQQTTVNTSQLQLINSQYIVNLTIKPCVGPNLMTTFCCEQPHSVSMSLHSKQVAREAGMGLVQHLLITLGPSGPCQIGKYTL